MTPIEIGKEVVKILDNKKAENIRLIGIRDISILADYFVIASGTSTTHVKSLADEVEYELKQLGVTPGHIEGHDTKAWILLDYGSVVVHVFCGETRDFYDLERLWQDGEQVDISALLK